MSLVQRTIRATREGRLLSVIGRRIYVPFQERLLRNRIGLSPKKGKLPVAETRSGDFSTHNARLLEAAFRLASNHYNLPDEVRAIEGMSGQRYRSFINSLIRTIDRPRYLEI